MLCCTLSTVSWDSTLDRYVRSLRAEVWRKKFYGACEKYLKWFISSAYILCSWWQSIFWMNGMCFCARSVCFRWCCVCWRGCVGGVRHGTHCVIECKEHGCVKQVVFVSRLESVLMWCPWIPCYKLYKNNEEEEKREKENVKKVMCLCFMYVWRVEGRMNDSFFSSFCQYIIIIWCCLSNERKMLRNKLDHDQHTMTNVRSKKHHTHGLLSLCVTHTHTHTHTHRVCAQQSGSSL